MDKTKLLIAGVILVLVLAVYYWSQSAETVTLPTGSVGMPDGSIALPSGAVVLPPASSAPAPAAESTPVSTPVAPVVKPAPVVLPTGTQIPASAPVVLPSGTVVAASALLKNVTGCEAQPATMTCPAGQVITSGQIKYGRWDLTSCPHSTVRSTTPLVSKVYPLPAKYLGAQTSTISGGMHIAVGNDPLPNVYKQYSIDYTCK